MVFKLLVLTVALIGMASATGPAGEPAHGATHPDADDPDAGFRSFGKLVSGFTILAALVIAAVLILMLLSVFGVFERDEIDPLV